MKIILAPDSFKESLSAFEAAAAMASGVRRALPDAQCVLRPMADGGEGTVDALLAAHPGGERHESSVCGPDSQPVRAVWGWLGDGIAVVEAAAAAGLELTTASGRDILRATTFGLGQQIRQALDAGARRLILGLGGSATNDGGAGMLQALGARLLDGHGKDLVRGGAALAHLHRIDLSGFDPRLSEIDIQVACDVNNPLCGPHGASAIFGPQKGASPEQVRQLDAALAHFADISAQALGHDLRDQPGAGAAGGLGYAALAYLNAQFRPGVEVVAEACGLAAAVQGADLVVTGEGRMDAQTLHGKTPAGVARIARAAGVPVIGLAGSLGAGYQALYEIGVDAAFSVVDGPCTLAYAMTNAGQLMTDRTHDIIRLWLAGSAHRRPAAHPTAP